MDYVGKGKFFSNVVHPSLLHDTLIDAAPFLVVDQIVVLVKIVKDTRHILLAIMQQDAAGDASSQR